MKNSSDDVGQKFFFFCFLSFLFFLTEWNINFLAQFSYSSHQREIFCELNSGCFGGFDREGGVSVTNNAF